MSLFCNFPPSVRTLSPFAMCLALWIGSAQLIRADEKPVTLKELPESLEDLKAYQAQVKRVLARAIPATVGVRVGNSAGSGVIIDKEGHVLTAAHVSGAPDVEITLILSDGKTVKGKTLGLNRGRDSGLIKITEKGDWPFVEMGKSADLKPGQWCIATGHPNGYRPGRPPVVRIGRVQGTGGGLIRTDCALVGGDSGGPLFDLDGKVIGIHSSIGGQLVQNQHVPIDTFHETWDRLARGDAWGGRGPVVTANAPWMGIERDPEEDRCIIKRVFEGSPAEKAGLKPDDLILKFDGTKIDNFEELPALILKKKVGDKVMLEVQRGKEIVKLELVLGKRQG